MKKWMRTETFAAWAFMAPGLLIVAVFVLWPIVYGLPLSLTDYSVIGETHYVGVDNYVTAFQDKSFLASLWNSMVYVLIVPIIQVISILMAILVNSRIPLIKAFRAAYYIPVVTSMVAVALMWSWLFSSNGVINYALIQLGVIQEQVGWLSSSNTALYVIMFITMWKGLGYYMMLYLAGLQSIPTDLYEASMIDGASRWQTIYRITIPLLRPHILFCTLISLMGAIRVFDEVFVLTNGKGGPGTATLTSSLYIYQKGLVQFNFGYASALGLIVSVIVGILSILVFRLNKKGGVQTY